MDSRKQEELQLLGFFGIYKESYKLFRSNWKFFSKITLALILPLSFIFLAHIEFSFILLEMIMATQYRLDKTSGDDSPKYLHLHNRFNTQIAGYMLFVAGSLACYVTLSILSTSAVVYTITSILTTSEFTFRNVINIVPGVWKRLLTTLICNFVTIISFSVIPAGVLVLIVSFFGTIHVSGMFLIPFVFLFYIGIVYLATVCNIACVVSVLEESDGVEAMMKSRKLIQGKRISTVFIYVKLYLVLEVIFVAFLITAVGGYRTFANTVLYANLWWLVLSVWNLFWLVIQTVIYMVCKSDTSRKY